MMHKRHPRLLRWWQNYAHWAITINGDDRKSITVTWWSADDIHTRQRSYPIPVLIDAEIKLPRWLWRPYCWRYKHEDYYGYCVTCNKPMKDSPYYRRK